MKAFHIPRDQYRFIIIIEMLKYTLTPAPLFCRVRVRAVLVPVAKSRRKKNYKNGYISDLALLQMAMKAHSVSRGCDDVVVLPS